MDKSYSVMLGGLKKTDSVLIIFKYYFWKAGIWLKRLCIYGSSFLITMLITLYVFQCSIIPKVFNNEWFVELSDCISLGSIFATFGSAIIAIMSLTAASQLVSFEEKKEVLNVELGKQNISSWKRWEFLPRYSKEKRPNGKNEYFILENATIIFGMNPISLAIPIPTVKNDFYDLPILRKKFLMNTKYKSYKKYILENGNSSDLMIWNCLSSMYKNVIMFRISQFILSIGVEFVINSILFAFFYKYIYCII